MAGLEGVGKLFLILGAVFFALGVFFTLAGRVGWIGRLPGDIRIDRDNFSFYFRIPVTMMAPPTSCWPVGSVVKTT